MRFASLVVAASLSLCAARPAAAQSDPAPFVTPEEYHSPQHFAMELKGGPYSPAIDSTPGLTGTPFADLFDSQFVKNKSGQYVTAPAGQQPASKPLFTLELDWQIWHPFGSLGVAGSVGVEHRSTHAFQYVPNTKNSCVWGSCIRSGDTTALTVMPFMLEFVYRFDVLALRYRWLPIVPYFKGGLGYFFWFIQNGAGDLASSLDGKQSAIGGTPGFVLHPGVSLMLDSFDPSSARTLDSELGINHTYLFFELNYMNATGLGFKNKMVFSDTTWNTGMAFEF